MPNEFFDEQLPGSKIKSQIVSSYFWKWAKVMIPHVKKSGSKIGYMDFFCGPGKYEDGSDSTPILILKAAISNPEMANMLVCVFNDNEPTNIDKLENEINSITDIGLLKYKPQFLRETVGVNVAIELKQVELIPSLIFIDPFGYKGLSLGLIASTIKDWGCDCIFFFNYNRINAAIRNPFMTDLINSIFGEETANYLRNEVENLSPDQREDLVLKCFINELKKVKGEYSISFKFYQEDGSKTSHFIFFVAKHPLAYALMKQTMADNCEWRGGIPTYEYNPTSNHNQMTLFGEDNYAIVELSETLLKIYKGKTTNRRQIYEEHNIGTPYVENNYKEAILLLEKEGKVIVEPPIDKRRKYNGQPTLGETVILKF